MRPLRPHHHERGATLIELMISLLLFSILAAGTFVAMSSQQESSRKLGRTTDMFDTTRTALNTLAMQLATIKSGMPFGVATLNANADFVSTDTLANVTCSGSYSGARPQGMDPAIALPTGTLVPVIVVDNKNNGESDSIRILRPDGRAWGGLAGPLAQTDTNIGLITMMSPAPSPLPPPIPLAANNLALITNFEHALLFRVRDVGTTGCAAGDTCVTEKNTSSYPTGMTYDAGHTLLQARWQAYRVGQFLGTDALTVTDEGEFNTAGRPITEPVAMNIENMQVALGIDGLNGGALNGVVDANEWAYDGSGATLVDPCALGNLRAIRITLVARARHAEEGAQLGVPQIEDRPAQAQDGFYRVISSTTVAVRQ